MKNVEKTENTRLEKRIEALKAKNERLEEIIKEIKKLTEEALWLEKQSEEDAKMAAAISKLKY